MARIAVLGTGGWGTALAIMCSGMGHEVTLWSVFPEEIRKIQEAGENVLLLPGVNIPKSIHFTSDINCAEGKDLLILAVPSFAVRETSRRLRDIVKPGDVLVNVAKGLEDHSLKRLSVVIKEEVPQCEVVVLSGPSHAEEVARGIPTSVVCASVKPEAARRAQDILMNPNFRVYREEDVIGTALGGAVKNVIAVASGVCDGLGLGDNTKAALITRGLAEITRLGCAMGAKESTFAGLSGIGDLVVTCTSMHSRNRRFGILIGEGCESGEALKKVGMTVEGYHATKAVYTLAQEHHVDMPIITQCYRILYEHQSPGEAIMILMKRPKR